ncbi:MAG: 23S rRNA (guanosine(2251)-2'-O)-methyltransferase RlmB [Oscillospiraceae bacterium]
MEREQEQQEQQEREGQIEGRNAVMEALRAGWTLDKVYIAAGNTDKGLAKLSAAARASGALVVETDRRKLDAMSVTHAHQGVVAFTPAVPYHTVHDLLDRARSRGEAPLLVACDEIEDPHNLGAIIRTAEAAGAHGVIIPKRRSVGLTATVLKTSAGALTHLPVARVPNLTAALRTLKQEGLWVFGTAADAEVALYQADLKGPAVLVIGSEGKGMGRLVGETCDQTVHIPMYGAMSSLNASVAAAVMLYEAVRQRQASL